MSERQGGNMSDELNTAITEYTEAKAAHEYHAERDCAVSGLKGVLDRGGTPRGRWPESIAKFELPAYPTAEDVEAQRAARREALDVMRAAGDRLYKALLEAGQAYTVVDHSDRLASRPFEVTPANLPYVERSFLSAHGSHLRLARYASREAAERAAAKITAAELERLS